MRLEGPFLVCVYRLEIFDLGGRTRLVQTLALRHRGPMRFLGALSRGPIQAKLDADLDRLKAAIDDGG